MSSVANLQKQERLDLKPFKSRPKSRKQDRVDLQRPLAKPTKGVGRGGGRKNHKPPTEFKDLSSDLQSKIFYHMAKMPTTRPPKTKGPKGNKMHLSIHDWAPSGMRDVGKLAATSKSFHEPLSRMLGGTTKPNVFGNFHTAEQAKMRHAYHHQNAVQNYHDMDAMMHSDARRGSRATFGYDKRTRRYKEPNLPITAQNVRNLKRDHKFSNKLADSTVIDKTKFNTNRLMTRIGNPNRATSRKLGGDGNVPV